MPSRPIEVYFATNRNRQAGDGYFGERFHRDGPGFYRCGRAVVNYDADRDEYTFDGAQVDGERRPNPETGNRGYKGSSAMFKRIRDRLQAENRDAIVLIHGFGSTFEQSLARGAELVREYRVNRASDNPDAPEEKSPIVVVFSWPSNGRVFPPWEYYSDREDAQQSGDAIARFFMRFWDFVRDPGNRVNNGRVNMGAGHPLPCDRRVHLVAHSMGNWALRAAVQSVKRLMDGRQVPKVFDNVFLMAADADDDALSHPEKLQPILDMARAVHVYHAGNDTALTVSDWTKFNPDRLGADGPRSFTDLPPHVTAVDCSDVSRTELSHGNHQYYRMRPEVTADVRHVLTGTYRPDRVPNRAAVAPGHRYRIKEH